MLTFFEGGMLAGVGRSIGFDFFASTALNEKGVVAGAEGATDADEEVADCFSGSLRFCDSPEADGEGCKYHQEYMELDHRDMGYVPNVAPVLLLQLSAEAMVCNRQESGECGKRLTLGAETGGGLELVPIFVGLTAFSTTGVILS
jgi:hypothetical protein